MKRKLMTMVAATVAATCLTGVFGQTAQAGAFPADSCRNFFGQQGPRLCMTDFRGPQFFRNAEFDCQTIKGRVSDYNDWYYRRFRGDGVLPPEGIWLGPRTADDTALFVNNPSNFDNFDGETSAFESRIYTCSHDDTKD